MRKALIAVAILLLTAAAAFFLLNRESSYDRSFDTRVATPAYRDSGPVVLYDEGHRNTHTASGAYRPLVEMLRSDGYVVRTTAAPFTPDALRGVAVLMLVSAQGSNPTNDSAAYTEAETAAIAEWVRGGGGSLLLVMDHWPYGLAVRSLARRFDVDVQGGFVEDPAHHEAERGTSHLVFSEENGLLRAHPITRGVKRVLTFTGTSVRGPAGAVAFLALSDSATERPPGPARAETTGGDTRVLMESGPPRPAAGRAQGIALEVGRGRVVVLGEAGMLRAQRDRSGLVGMNVPGYDNRQLALNIVHWLSRVM